MKPVFLILCFVAGLVLVGSGGRAGGMAFYCHIAGVFLIAIPGLVDPRKQ